MKPLNPILKSFLVLFKIIPPWVLGAPCLAIFWNELHSPRPDSMGGWIFVGFGIFLMGALGIAILWSVVLLIAGVITKDKVLIVSNILFLLVPTYLTGKYYYQEYEKEQIALEVERIGNVAELLAFYLHKYYLAYPEKFKFDGRYEVKNEIEGFRDYCLNQAKCSELLNQHKGFTVLSSEQKDVILDPLGRQYRFALDIDSDGFFKGYPASLGWSSWKCELRKKMVGVIYHQGGPYPYDRKLVKVAPLELNNPPTEDQRRKNPFDRKPCSNE